MPRSGSDQHLPRVDYTSITTPARHTLLRSSLKSGTSALRYNTRYGQTDITSAAQRQGQFGTLTRRHRPSLDYASDTEATCSSSPKSAYYYYRHNMNNPPQSSVVSHLATLSRSQIGQSSSGLRSNSLPRSGRTLPQQPGLRSGLSTVASGLIDQEDSDGALSAPELPSIRRDRGRIPSSPSVFTSDEYRAWLSRTPSTSALYEQIRATTSRPPRYTYSAENIHAAVNQGEYGSYGTYRPLSSTLDRLSTRSASAQQVNLANLRASTAISSTCHRGTTNPRPASVASSARSSLVTQKPSLTSSVSQRATSVRRIRNLLDLESTRSIPTPTPTRTQGQILLDINPAEFLKYKIEKPPTVGTPSSTSSLLSSLGETTGGDFASGVSGLLSVHLLAGRGLRTTTTSSAATTPSTPSGQPNLASCGLRDLYCVLECDRVHKARTVVRTGDLMFDWDETFELDLVGNRQLDLLVYSWDPQYRHKLCYKGSVHLASLLKESPEHQLAVKVEPRGTIYLKLRYTDAQQTFRRRGLPVISLATRVAPLFGVDLDTVVSRETKTGGVPGGVSTALAMGVSNVPIIVWRCVEEVERRGLDIIGLYRLCGSATKKRILREAFERNARSVNLSPDNVPDINVITGVLKDYLRELPEPLFTKCLYQMMVDALAVCLPDDPQGNAKLMFSILDCLPKVNRCTLIYLLDHLAMVVSQCNKMSPASLAVCFGPVLMLHSDENAPPLDFQQPIAVLKYLLEIWPVKSVRKTSSVGSTLPRVMPAVERSSSQQHLQQAQQLVQQQLQVQLQGTLGRTGLPWQQPPSLHHQPQTTAAAVLGPSIRPPPPVKPRQEDANVVILDWTRGAGTNYAAAVANSELVGRQLALILLDTINLGINPIDIHVIGFSLGAHVAGCASEVLKRKNLLLGRITGLDPASPFFRHHLFREKSRKLDATDAHLVDVIHTDGSQDFADGFGLLKPIGHIDFFPNGGREQPGCTDVKNSVVVSHLKEELLDRNIACSHLRAWQLFIESIRSQNKKCKFIAWPCPQGGISYAKGTCFPMESTDWNQEMGYAANRGPLGIYYLSTRAETPFCGQPLRASVMMSEDMPKTSGILFFKIFLGNSTTLFKIKCTLSKQRNERMMFHNIATAEFDTLLEDTATITGIVSYQRINNKTEGDSTSVNPETDVILFNKLTIEDRKGHRWEYCRTNTAINSHEMNEILYVELKNEHCTPL